MNEMTKLTRYSASAAMELLAGGVLLVRLAGPLTADALRDFKGRIVARHGPQVRAFVVDYTSAAVALSDADLDALLEGEGRDSAPAMPAAMVVRCAMVETFTAHAARMALLGIRRRVFLAQPEALCWAHQAAGRPAAQ